MPLTYTAVLDLALVVGWTPPINDERIGFGWPRFPTSAHSSPTDNSRLQLSAREGPYLHEPNQPDANFLIVAPAREAAPAVKRTSLIWPWPHATSAPTRHRASQWPRQEAP
jgi:hypothetical protein